MIKFKIIKYVLLALTLLGTVSGAKLTLQHLKVGEVCPMIGPIPACAIVFIGYLLMFIATLFIGVKGRIGTNGKIKIFYIGWLPIFLLALFGVVVEFTGTHICPPGALGIPQCFYSLALLILCLVLFIVARRGLQPAHEKQG